ncbi:50S ribosomal protein L21 [Patescibacteria group bacterium]|nr:50S ribosomal protein L21 [Patescibacteria group bacterium]
MVGGKQYRVSPGNVVTVEKVEQKEGSALTFDQVLLYQTSTAPVLGTPFVTGATVTAEVLGQVKGPKIRVFTYKPKKRQRRTLGHRQQLTQVKILEIKTPSSTKEKHESA